MEDQLQSPQKIHSQWVEKYVTVEHGEFELRSRLAEMKEKERERLCGR